jgi:hypothetical protein
VDHKLYEKLLADGLIGDESFSKIQQKQANPLLSVYWEVKTVLYISIILFTTGLGIIIYKNIDTIGHQAILAVIALITIACFIYCYKHKQPFSKNRIQSQTSLFDYILLLGTLCFLIFVGYLQHQYNVFGDNYGMATFIPMLVLFYIAYSFDHSVILNLAIINLGIWMGVTVTPKQLIKAHTFDNLTAIYTYLTFSTILLMGAWLSYKFDFKSHYKFSYQHYGVHLIFITLIAGYFFYYDSNYFLLWDIGILAVGYILFIDAYKQKSFYFLLLVVLYGYIAFSSLVLKPLIKSGSIYPVLMYLILSSAGLVFSLIYLNKKLKEE